MKQSSSFLTTQWSVVLAAGLDDATGARDAMATLCRLYWQPLYAYVRRRGYSAHDAEDLTQGFFLRLLERSDVSTVRPERGKFRSYLLGAMNHYLSDEWDKTQAQKRGGGKVISLDFDAAESAYLHLAEDDRSTPDQLYDQRWAMTVLGEVQRRLRQEYEADGKLAWFDALRFTLMADRNHAPYLELARQLDSTEGAVKVAAHRLRRRYRRLLRELVADTVASNEDVDEELRYLLRALATSSEP